MSLAQANSSSIYDWREASRGPLGNLKIYFIPFRLLLPRFTSYAPPPLPTCTIQLNYLAMHAQAGIDDRWIAINSTNSTKMFIR